MKHSHYWHWNQLFSHIDLFEVFPVEEAEYQWIEIDTEEDFDIKKYALNGTKIKLREVMEKKQEGNQATLKKQDDGATGNKRGRAPRSDDEDPSDGESTMRNLRRKLEERDQELSDVKDQLEQKTRDMQKISEAALQDVQTAKDKYRESNKALIEKVQRKREELKVARDKIAELEECLEYAGDAWK